MNRKTNQGITLVGLLLTIIGIVLAGIVIIRTVPVYLEYYSVHESITALKTIPSADFSTDPAANAIMLRKRLLNQLYVNSVDIPDEGVKIVPLEHGNFKVSIKYQAVRHLFANISLLFDFDTSEEVSTRAGNESTSL